MFKQIFNLLPQEERRKCLWVALSVLIKALLDFAGIASLLPVLVIVLGDKPDIPKALIVCAGVFAFIIVKSLLYMALTRVQSRFLLRLYSQFSYRMFCNYYRRGLLFLKSKSSVQLGHEVNFICYAFCLNILSPLMAITGQILLVLLMVLALIIWSPKAGLLLCIGFIPLIYIYIKVVKVRARKYGLEELEARRKQARTVVEAFRGYAELEINNAFHTLQTSFSDGLDLINKCRFRMETIGMLPQMVSEASIVVGLALLLCIGDGDIRIMSGVFAVAAFRLIPAVRGIMGCWTTLQTYRHTITTVADGIKDEEELKVENELDTISFNHEIKVDHLNFTFPDGGEIFHDFSCVIRKGERVGLRGVSGSGKSTLFNILLGFFPATKGSIHIDDQLLNPQSIHAWHKLAGYVPQEIFIVQGSLAQNVALGCDEIDESRVRHVLKQVQLLDWLNTLPEGIDTHLGEYGSRLSGGQKQRIGIARALYKQAEVFFFDEATSALDNQTESEINQAITDLSNTHRELTIIIIAHRETSLTLCDRIITINED